MDLVSEQVIATFSDVPMFTNPSGFVSGWYALARTWERMSHGLPLAERSAPRAEREGLGGKFTI